MTKGRIVRGSIFHGGQCNMTQTGRGIAMDCHADIEDCIIPFASYTAAET